MKRKVCFVCGGDLTYGCGEWHCTVCDELNDIAELYEEYGEISQKKKVKKDSLHKSEAKEMKSAH